ncbi:MAG TPA: hypothetical protein PLQ54_08035 [Armatimonadota bacterium]|nr:hypothetical protein [Armatimonadota bacterium]
MATDMLAVALIVTLWQAASSDRLPPNLLANPGFEDARADNPVPGWQTRVSGDVYIRSESRPVAYGPDWPCDVASGAESVTIAARRGGGARLWQEVPAAAGALYSAAVWVKTYDADGQGFGHSPRDHASLRVDEISADGRIIHTHRTAGPRPATNRWVRLATSLQTDAATTRLRLTLKASIRFNHWHGRVKFDDASLCQVAALPSLQPEWRPPGGPEPVSARHSEEPAPTIVVAERGGPPVSVVTSSSEPALAPVAEWCRSFLVQRGFSVLPCGQSASRHRNGPVWALEVARDSPVARSLDVRTGFLEHARGDAFALAAGRRDGRPTLGIVAKDVAGVRAGMARLVAELWDEGSSFTQRSGRREYEPFIPVRLLSVAPTGRDAQGGPWADTLWTNWTDERLRRYAEQIWLCGYNGIEVAEIRGYRAVYSDQELTRSITPKIRVLCSAARDYGLKVRQFIWGQSLFVEGQNLCWNAPDERSRMLAEYRRLAQTYGDLVDELIVHVGDPGGCDRNGCDAYKTTQEIAMALLAEYRRVNPKVTAVLSTWANAGFWRGHPNAQLLDETYSPKELGIALHRWYDRDKVDCVRASGRAVDLWTWYLSDFEMAVDLTLAMRVVDRYYRALPASARGQIRGATADLCFHGWPQILGAYVAAQKMWDPQRGLSEIEHEFCAATFGERNADAMVALYQACEAHVHPGRYAYFRPETDCPPVVLGTPDYDAQLRTALEQAGHVDLRLPHEPRLVSATDPAALYQRLLDYGRLIGVASHAMVLLREARQTGAAANDLQAIVDAARTEAEPYAADPGFGPLMDAVAAAARGT